MIEINKQLIKKSKNIWCKISTCTKPTFSLEELSRIPWTAPDTYDEAQQLNTVCYSDDILIFAYTGRIMYI